MGKLNYKWPCSIVFLYVYQRVTNHFSVPNSNRGSSPASSSPTTSTARRFTRCWMASRRSAAPMDDRAAASSPMELGPCWVSHCHCNYCNCDLLNPKTCWNQMFPTCFKHSSDNSYGSSKRNIFGCVWKRCVPLNPMVFMIIIPIKWLFHWEYTLFSDKPICSYICWNQMMIFHLKRPFVWRSQWFFVALSFSFSFSALHSLCFHVLQEGRSASLKRVKLLKLVLEWYPKLCQVITL